MYNHVVSLAKRYLAKNIIDCFMALLQMRQKSRKHIVRLVYNFLEILAYSCTLNYKQKSVWERVFLKNWIVCKSRFLFLFSFTFKQKPVTINLEKYEARKTTIIECEISVWMSLRNENSFVCGLIVSAGEFCSRFFLAHQTLVSGGCLLWRIEKAVELEIEILMPFLLFVCFHS